MQLRAELAQLQDDVIVVEETLADLEMLWGAYDLALQGAHAFVSIRLGQIKGAFDAGAIHVLVRRSGFANAFFCNISLFLFSNVAARVAQIQLPPASSAFVQVTRIDMSHIPRMLVHVLEEDDVEVKSLVARDLVQAIHEIEQQIVRLTDEVDLAHGELLVSVAVRGGCKQLRVQTFFRLTPWATPTSLFLSLSCCKRRGASRAWHGLSGGRTCICCAG